MSKEIYRASMTYKCVQTRKRIQAKWMHDPHLAQSRYKTSHMAQKENKINEMNLEIVTSQVFSKLQDRYISNYGIPEIKCFKRKKLVGALE
jgi:hypothetical protein